MKKLRLEELGRISVAEFKATSKLPAVFLLDNVRSLNNVDSAFRTADAFRVSKIYLAGITGTPPHREIHKTALGATESVDWEYAADAATLVQRLKSEGYQILAIEQTTGSTPLDQFTPLPNQHYCLVFGNEIDGVSDAVIDLCDGALEIPQHGTKHSLNISVCVGIVTWEVYSRLTRVGER